MLESHWLLTEGAAIVLPAASTALYARNGRKRMTSALRAPLFWDGGQPVSLATLYIELNGEVDLCAAIGETLSIARPQTPQDLLRAVARLQGEPAATKRLVLDLATEVAFKGNLPHAAGSAAAGVGIMERLTEAHSQLNFFAFMAELNGERPGHLPPLLPIEALLPGGLPVAPPEGSSHYLPGPIGVLGVLGALGLGRQGEWLPGVVKAVEDLLRERRVKKARDQYHRALGNLGAAAGEALRRRSPAGQQLRRNVYSPLDAYRNLATRTKAGTHHPKRGGLMSFVVPDVERALQMEFLARLARATALVADKCVALERTLLGRNGSSFAGEVLYKHRDGLLVSVAADTFPLAAIDAALEEYVRMRDEGHAAQA